MVVIPINELSFKVPSDRSDRDLLVHLSNALQALRRTVPEHHRGDLSFRSPDAIGIPPRLPGGTAMSKAIEAIAAESGERTLLLMLLDFPGLPCEELEPFSCNGEPACGLGHALRSGVPAVSLAVPDWEMGAALS